MNIIYASFNDKMDLCKAFTHQPLLAKSIALKFMKTSLPCQLDSEVYFMQIFIMLHM